MATARSSVDLVNNGFQRNLVNTVSLRCNKALLVLRPREQYVLRWPQVGRPSCISAISRCSLKVGGELRTGVRKNNTLYLK
eukprot:3955319-Heterocapsa_arctica.AAC.1